MTRHGASLLRANAIALPLADESVDLIVTSPPYFALRSYQDGGEHYDGQIGSEATPQAFLDALWAVTAECRRVLKPIGSMFVNLGDKYAGTGGGNGQSGLLGKHAQVSDVIDNRSMPRNNTKQTSGFVRAKSLMGLPWRYANGCVDQLDLILRAEIVWSKPNGLPESVTDRVRRSHEQWFHMTKEPRYFAAVDEVREPHTWTPSDGYQGHGRADRGGGPEHTFSSLGNPLGKLPGSVWTVPTEPLVVPDYFVEDAAGWRMMDAGPLWQWARNRTERGDWSPVRVDVIDHFAAFPQEWPRRFILGWSPSGICVECGEGRRPVVDKREELAQATNNPYRTQGQMAGRSGVADFTRMTQTTTITGYACACPDTSAPTRPAVVLDPFGGTGTTAMVARALGRYGVSVDLSADYLRLAHWRIFESGHAAKSRQRTNLEAQGSLLGGAA